jgi:hypothetical protein
MCKSDMLFRLITIRFEVEFKEYFMQPFLEQNFIADSVINKTNTNFGGRIGIVATVFGCQHRRLGRPFTTNRESYRSCLQCGARKHFDSENLKTFGSFYYPPIVSAINK